MVKEVDVIVLLSVWFSHPSSFLIAFFFLFGFDRVTDIISLMNTVPFIFSIAFAAWVLLPNLITAVLRVGLCIHLIVPNFLNASRRS